MIEAIVFSMQRVRLRDCYSSVDTARRPKGFSSLQEFE